MDFTGELGARLSERLQGVEAERKARAAAVEAAMREQQEGGARLAEAAEPIHSGVVCPMVEILASNFDNATVETLRLSRAFVARCRFVPTGRYPARVSFAISLEWDEDGQHARLVAVRDIMPVLMPFDATERLEVSLLPADEDAIASWVQQRIESFVEAYLRVESGPEYQFGRIHTDPVCGMQVRAGLADHVSECRGTTYHFCSTVCQSRFNAMPESYGV